MESVTPEDENSNSELVIFITEQLSLPQTKKKGLCYSSPLIRNDHFPVETHKSSSVQKISEILCLAFNKPSNEATCGFHCQAWKAKFKLFKGKNFKLVTTNEMFLPMKCTDDCHSGLEFMKEATLIFKEWQKSGKSGLTAETFLACIQTITAVPALADYLQEQHKFKYLLSGRLMSHPIEGRFGWYRQCNGANIFVPVNQVLVAENKTDA